MAKGASNNAQRRKATASATINDIANQAGLSQAVVSSVLRGGSSNIRYSTETRQRVLETASALRYRPRVAHGVGVLHATGSNRPEEGKWVEWIAPLLGSMHLEAMRDDRLLSVFCYTSADLDLDLADHKLPQIFKRRRIDGVIVSGVFDDPLISHVAEINMPYVLVNVSNGDKYPRNSLVFDELGTGRQATQHLIDRGYRRILHVSVRWSSDHYSVQARRQGYEQAMRAAGLTPQVVEFVSPDCPDTAAAIRAALDSPDPPEAVFAYNEQVSVYVHRLLYDAGRSYRDVALMGVAWMDTKTVELLGISHVELPAAAMGRQAYQALLQRIETRRDVDRVVLKGRVLDLGSTPGWSRPN